MNAAIYASRMNLSTAIIEKYAPGGKLVNISKIENYLGFEDIGGPELAMKMDKHARAFGTESIYGDVKKINDKENTVELADGTKVEYKFLIIATGTSEKVPEDIKGIHNFTHKGVSYCAICDGPLYKGASVAVIGAGNSAVEEAHYLTSVAKEVHIFVRNEFRAEKKAIDGLMAKQNVVLHKGHKILEILGDSGVEKIITTDGEIEVKAIFPYIGLKPNSDFIEGTAIASDNGFIKVNDVMQTSVENIFAVGDVIDKKIRQISTASADGTIAAKVIANLI